MQQAEFQECCRDYAKIMGMDTSALAKEFAVLGAPGPGTSEERSQAKTLTPSMSILSTTDMKTLKNRKRCNLRCPHQLQQS